MDDRAIRKLVDNLRDSDKDTTLKQTHISYIILVRNLAYKIKKTIRFSFADFTSLDKRRYYCEQEVKLNGRLAPEMYLRVEPVSASGSSVEFGDHNVVDYAVVMKRKDERLQMDNLLKKSEISEEDAAKIADAIADFHRHTNVVTVQNPSEQLKLQFNDILSINETVSHLLGAEASKVISKSIECSDRFVERHAGRLRKRDSDGWRRDCHGDLHSGNIFLEDKPVIFDCIEFNDDFRHIDVLNEIAFFCMDMDYYRRQDLGDTFYRRYLDNMHIKEDSFIRKLFFYYKCYRANIRAKVIGLTQKPTPRQKREVLSYLDLMRRYLQEFN